MNVWLLLLIRIIEYLTLIILNYLFLKGSSPEKPKERELIHNILQEKIQEKEKTSFVIFCVCYITVHCNSNFQNSLKYILFTLLKNEASKLFYHFKLLAQSNNFSFFSFC